MKSLTLEQTKDIKGGAVSGALLTGFSNIIGKTSDFVIDVAMLPFAYIEAAKGHDKAKFKVGRTSFEFDDSTSAKMNNNNLLKYRQPDFAELQNELGNNLKNVQANQSQPENVANLVNFIKQANNFFG